MENKFVFGFLIIIAVFNLYLGMVIYDEVKYAKLFALEAATKSCRQFMPKDPIPFWMSEKIEYFLNWIKWTAFRFVFLASLIGSALIVPAAYYDKNWWLFFYGINTMIFAYMAGKYLFAEE